MKCIFQIAVMVLWLTYVNGQQPDFFVPAPVVKTDTGGIGSSRRHLDEDLIRVKDKKGKVKDYIESRLKARLHYYEESVKDGDFYYNTELNRYVNQIAAIILEANPELPPVRIFVSRYSSPNAFNTGDGNIVVNLGLLNKLENDGQLVCILAHEIAHQYRDHGFTSISKMADKYMSKEFQAQLKKALKEDYNVKEKIRNLVMPELFSDMRFSRAEELEADSLGFLYALKAGFDTSCMSSTMTLLGRIDTYYDETPLDLHTLLPISHVPFQDEWLDTRHSTSSLGMIEDEKDSLEDSLKTHPDTKLRLEASIRQSKTLKVSGNKKFITDSITFENHRLLADEEMISTYYENFSLGRMMFQAFQVRARHPENPYAITMSAIGFARLNYLQSIHKVQTEVSLPDKEYEKSYNNFITFLNNVRMSESNSLGYWTINPSKKEWMNIEDYVFANYYTSLQLKKEDETKKYKSDYLNKFPKGKYLTIINYR